jgi:hypothetical protein
MIPDGRIPGPGIPCPGIPGPGIITPLGRGPCGIPPCGGPSDRTPAGGVIIVRGPPGIGWDIPGMIPLGRAIGWG